jgi:hypothetical protein
MSLPNSVASGKKIYDIGNAQFNTMVCKQTVNLSREQKKWEAAGAGSHFVPGPVWGRAPGKTRLNVTQRKGNCAKDFFSLGFPNNPTNPSPSTGLFRDYGTDLDGVSVQGSRDRGDLSGLLVQSVQSRFVGCFEGIDLVADDQRELGSVGYAGASTLGSGLALHVLSAAHGVSYLACKGALSAACRGIKIRKCRRCKNEDKCKDDCSEPPGAAIHSVFSWPPGRAALLAVYSI